MFYSFLFSFKKKILVFVFILFSFFITVIHSFYLSKHVHFTCLATTTVSLKEYFRIALIDENMNSEMFDSQREMLQFLLLHIMGSSGKMVEVIHSPILLTERVHMRVIAKAKLHGIWFQWKRVTPSLYELFMIPYNSWKKIFRGAWGHLPHFFLVQIYGLADLAIHSSTALEKKSIFYLGNRCKNKC